MIAEDDGYALIDVLNDESDIVAEVPVTHDGFRYLAKKLKWKWENREECEALHE